MKIRFALLGMTGSPAKPLMMFPTMASSSRTSDTHPHATNSNPNAMAFPLMISPRLGTGTDTFFSPLPKKSID
ncbi:MAG: hypothetical protein E4G96_04205 [Chrysiogenales bacterium]|nr:MAG: hypothetical protein E4G96_04205 [Chrysiogenales bacterium]